MDGRNAALLLALLIAAAVAVALLVFSNATYWSANATLPPVLKMGNSSLYPLSRSWYVLGPINTTYYYIKFMPGWPETYVIGQLKARDAGWSARLVEISSSGNPGGTYAISLGGQTQITNTQTAGPYVPVTAPLVWSMVATNRYSILARVWLNKGGIYAWQWANFTAVPMQKLYQQTFNCGYSYAFTSQPSWLSFYTNGDSKAYIGTTPNKLGSVTALVLDGKNGYAAAFVNVSQWIGPIPASWSFTTWWALKSALTGNDYAQLNFFISNTTNGPPSLEVVYYISVNGRSPVLLSNVIYGYSLPNVTVLYSSQSPTSPTSSPTWTKWSLSQVWSTGYIVGLALVIYSPNGETTGYFANITFAPSTCGLPSGWGNSGSVQAYPGYLQLSGNAVAYMGLISGALTYISNFTGTGTYAVLDSSLNVIFGVFKSGSSFAALCGSTSTALGVYPSAYYVELRPLNGFGDIIVRDQYGNILARYGCYYSATPYYVGFKTQSGQSMKVYNITAWG